jgi:hypothetical protein
MALLPRILLLAGLLTQAGLCNAAERAVPDGCRLAADDPLRLEVNRLMREGAAFEEEQRAALLQKVSRLGQARGWSKTEEADYLKSVIAAGVSGSWAQTLSVVAAFIRVCEEKSDGNQRAEAVRLFRELYVVEEQQWRSIHDAVDRETAAAGQ